MRKILTIAGSDCSGGAGIQADLKTITAHKMYGMSAITALTAQNTTGVYDIMNVSPEFLEQQLVCIFEDIVPDAVKIGMISNDGLLQVIIRNLIKYQAKNIVLDPVMISTSGRKLLDDIAYERVLQELLPMVDMVTPNIPEIVAMTGIAITSHEDMENAARKLSQITQAAILVKGGHFDGQADDLLFYEDQSYLIYGERIHNSNTHGTGCTLSSAIACNLANGHTMLDSVILAKEYLAGAIRDGLDLGKGNGPLNHCYRIHEL